MTAGGEKGPVSPQDSALELIGDSHLHVRDRTTVPIGAPPYILENVLFSKVGHTFGPLPAPPPGYSGPPLYLVQDFLLDQTGASGADGKMSATKTFDLTTTTTYRFGVFPSDRSKRVKVTPPATPPQLPQVFIGLDVGRKFDVTDDFDQYPAQSFFLRLVGTPPVLTYNSFFISRNTNHRVQFMVDQEMVSPISFFGFGTIGTYPPRSFDPGSKSYSPYNSSQPLSLPDPGPDGAPYLFFSCLTTSSSDPGPFVVLE